MTGQAAQVNPDTGMDHYFSAVDVDEQTGRIAVTYARTGRVPNENTTPSDGFAAGMPGVQDRKSDYVLAWAPATSTAGSSSGCSRPRLPRRTETKPASTATTTTSW